MGKTCSSLLVVTVVCSLAVVAEAQRRTPEAEALFDEGKALMKAGDPAGACRSFQASNNVDPRAATLMSIGACLEAQQKLVSAWRTYGEAQRVAAAAADVKEKALADSAKAKADELAPRLSTLEIAVAADARVPGLNITRNGELIGESLWNTKIPVDGGVFTVVAYGRGTDEWTGTVTVAAERDAQQVTIPALGKPPVIETPATTPVEAEPPPDSVPLTALPTPQDTEPEMTDRPGLHPWTWYAVAGGCIIAGLAIDLGAESSSNGKWDALDFVPLALYGAGVGLVYKERF